MLCIPFVILLTCQKRTIAPMFVLLVSVDGTLVAMDPQHARKQFRSIDMLQDVALQPTDELVLVRQTRATVDTLRVFVAFSNEPKPTRRALLPAMATQDNKPLLLELLGLGAQMQFADLSEQLTNVLFPTVRSGLPYHLQTPGQSRQGTSLPVTLDAAFIWLRHLPEHLLPKDGIVTQAFKKTVTLIWTCRVRIAESLINVLDTRYHEIVQLSDYHKNIIQRAADEFERNGRIAIDPYVRLIREIAQ